jgi:heterodisulfide reductase subunit B
MQEHPEIGRKVNLALQEGGLSYHPGTLWIRHILDVFINDIGLEYISDRVRTPLAKLTVAPYYGCMLVRPQCLFDHTEYPTSMDGLLEALGARVAPFSLRGYCCSGHLPHIKADTGFSIIHRILKNAQYDGADVIAVACPVCQVNLDLYQQDVNEKYGTSFDIPVLFFTQLMGLAFGLDRIGLGIGNEIIAADRKPEPSQRGGGRNGRTAAARPAALPMPDMEKDDF